MNATLRRHVILGSGAAAALPILAPFAASEVAGLEAGLLKRVFGQDHVIAAVAGAIRRAAFGASFKPTPVSFLFLGPRAVGKTQLAKALAGYLFGTDDALLRIDLSQRPSLDLAQLAAEAQSRRIILLDEIDRASAEARGTIAQLVRGDLPTSAASLRDSTLILTSGARTASRVLPAAPPALRQDVFAALHETVTFKQIDWREHVRP